MTIGQHVLYHPIPEEDSPILLLTDRRPCDAVVVGVHEDSSVDLQVKDHFGGLHFVPFVRPIGFDHYSV
jgi:hypothetical protein